MVPKRDFDFIICAKSLPIAILEEGEVPGTAIAPQPCNHVSNLFKTGNFLVSPFKHSDSPPNPMFELTTRLRALCGQPKCVSPSAHISLPFLNCCQECHLHWLQAAMPSLLSGGSTRLQQALWYPLLGHPIDVLPTSIAGVAPQPG